MISVLFATQGKSQPTIKVEVSSDTIMVGEIVEVVYTIENGEGKFTIPELKDLPVISGPNTSSSFLYQNGKMNSNQSYSFKLLPLQEGKLVIPKTTYNTNSETLTIQPVEIIVLASRDTSRPGKNNANPSPIDKTREKRKF